jgi:hypothetical protein
VSDLAAFLIGIGIGLVITAAVLWQKREEVAKALQQRGITPRAPSHHHLTITVHALAALGSAYIAVETSDSAVRAISLFVCLVAAASIAALLLRSRRST